MYDDQSKLNEPPLQKQGRQTVEKVCFFKKVNRTHYSLRFGSLFSFPGCVATPFFIFSD
jgi:hypothetical protein